LSNQKSLGSESNQKSLGSESNQKSLGSESNQKSLSSESNQKSLGSESNQKSLGSESNQKSLGSESKESLGSESNHRSLGIKLLLSVFRERAIKDPSASRFDRVIKRVSAASNWPSAQDVSPYKSISGMAAIRSLSLVRAIEESLGSKSKHEVLAGSIGQASKEAQQTDAGNGIITDEQ
jgi:hypothetical protein